jgi:hypothetical protein
MLAVMSKIPPDSRPAHPGTSLARTRETAGSSPPATVPLTPEGAAALEAAQHLARNASAPATLRAYKADWTHFADWCAAKGFVPVPAAPEVVCAYLASLADTHSPATIRRRLSALGKMHRYNDLPWNAAHGAIQGPLQGVLRRHGRPPQKAAALSLALLRKLLANCQGHGLFRRRVGVNALAAQGRAARSASTPAITALQSPGLGCR